LLKWAGGKSRLAPEVLALVPSRMQAYHEPFAGGAAIFFALRSGGYTGPATLADRSNDLITCLETVRDSVEPLIAELRILSDDYLLAHDRAEQYYEVRGQAPLDPVRRAARMIFLNKTCYNGLYRVNRRGEFNVPHGRYANPRILDEPNLRACWAALQGVDLRCEDFEAACDRAQAGDFVYLDPPYQPLSKTSKFTSYTKEDFGSEEQTRLRDTFDRLAERGVAAVLSNSDHECIRELYSGRGYHFETVTMSRAINSVGSKRQPIAELLIANRHARAMSDE
jgi:DNA adenine methylase